MATVKTLQIAHNNSDRHAGIWIGHNDPSFEADNIFLKIGSNTGGGFSNYGYFLFKDNGALLGAEILDARLILRTDNSFSASNNPLTNKIVGYKGYSGTGTTPSLAINPNTDVDGNVGNTTTVNWNFTPSTTANTEHTSPNIAAIIQEIIDHANFNDGNYNIEVIVQNLDQDTSDANFESYNDIPERSAKLQITYAPRVDSSRAAQVRGSLDTNSHRAAEITGRVDSRRWAEITGGVEEDDARLAQIRGGLDTNNERDAEILGGIADERGAEITGIPPNWYNLAWPYRYKVTVDYTKVATDVEDFPFVVNITDNALKSAQADGDDFVFTDSENNKIPHEIEYWNPSTGQLIAWVKAPALSDSENTDFYLYWGNQTVESQQDVTNTWPTDYKAVFHLSDLTTSTLKDSSSFANNATKGAANQPVEATGNIHKGQSFANNNYYAAADDANHLDFASSFALSIWVKTDNAQDIMSVFNKWAASNRNWWLGWVADTTIRLSLSTTGSNNLQFNVSSDIKDGGWHHILCAYVASTSVKIWVDGQLLDLISPPAIPASLSTGNAALRFSLASGDTNQGVLGVLDEAKLLTITDDNYLLTHYNNEKNQTTFATIGDFQSVVSSDNRNAEIRGGINEDDERSAEITGIERSDRNAEITGVARDWWDRDWAYRKEIEIKYTEVEGNNDLENIPILIDITDADFANAQDDGDDFVFVDESHTQVLPHEIDSFSSNRLQAWVKIPRLKYNENTKINVYWGNTSVSSQQDVANVWPVSYKGVYHLSDLTTSTIKDSSTFGNDGAKGAANQPVQADGQINKGQSWASNEYYIEADDDDSLDFAGAFSITVWVKNSNAQDIQTIINKWNTTNSDGKRNWWLGWVSDTSLRLSLSPDGSGNSQNNVTADIKDGEWHHIIVVYVPSTHVKIFVDGQELMVTSPSGIPASLHTDTSKLRFGRAASALDASSSHLGVVDETKLSTITDVDYLLTVYNNESDPTNFIIVGNTETNLTSDDRAAEITGIEFSDERDSEIRGGINEIDEREAEVRGKLNTASERDTEIIGQDFENNERDAEVTGQDFADDERDSEIHGIDTDTDERNAEIEGVPSEVEVDDERDAEIVGKVDIDDERDSEIHGIETNTNERNCEITGIATDANERDAELTGQANTIDERFFEIHGKQDDSNERDAEVSGIQTLNDSRDAEIHGKLDDADERGCEISGIDTDTSERDAEIEGVFRANDSRNAQITGAGIEDERVAEIHGQSLIGNDANAEIRGSLDDSDEREAEIHGQVSDSSQRSAEISGVAFSDDRYSEIHGKDVSTATRDAQIRGKLIASSEKSAQITGQPSFDSRSAEITGIASYSERGAEVTGGVIFSSRSAEIFGVIKSSNEKNAQITGAECPWFEDNGTIWQMKSETEWYVKNPKKIYQQKRKIKC